MVSHQMKQMFLEDRYVRINLFINNNLLVYLYMKTIYEPQHCTELIVAF